MGWTAERMDVLRKMWLDGKSSALIAKELGDVSRNAVMGKVHRMGLMGSNDHNTRMTGRVFGACRPIMVIADEPEAVVPAIVEPEPIMVEIVDPDLVRLSTGTIHKACAGMERGVVPDWRYAQGVVAELTGQPFSWERPGHKGSLVAIATILTGGDPRRLLCPKYTEPMILGMMRRFAAEGMVVGGKTPQRWCDQAEGDAAFFDDMLTAEGVKDRPAIERREMPDTVASAPASSVMPLPGMAAMPASRPEAARAATMREMVLA